METKEYLSKLKEDKLVYYVYQFTPEKYLIVCDKDHIDELMDLPGDIFPHILPIDIWFNMVQSGKLLAWRCACLNRKYIIKEHVKLLMATNPLQLRNDIDALYKDIIINYDDYSKEDLYYFVEELVYSIQIIDNHKIVNYNEPTKYSNIPETKEDFIIFVFPMYKELSDRTDGLLKKQLMDKIYAKINSSTGSSCEREVDMGEGVCEDTQKPCDSKQG